MHRTLVILVVMLLSQTLARAGVPDSTLQALKGRSLVVKLKGGTEVRGKVLAFDNEVTTLIDPNSGRVMTVERAQVIGLTVGQEPPPVHPSERRHIGLQAGVGPGNLMLDIDNGHFYGFAALSIGYPVIFSDENDQYAGIALAGGGQWRLSPDSRWKFTLVGTLIPTWWNGLSVGIGIAAGFHWTSDSGFTVGFQIPIFGVQPGDSMGRSTGTGALLIGSYYLAAAMQLPIASLGYRF